MEKKLFEDNVDFFDLEENGLVDDSKLGILVLFVNSDGGSFNGFMMGGDKLSIICNICFKIFVCCSVLDIYYCSYIKECFYKCEVCD